MYCADDFRRRFGTPCAICGARLLSWSTGPTGECYCPHHTSELPSCHGCGRLVAPNMAGATDLMDGRSACPRCSASAVHSLDEARNVLDRVRRFLIGRGVALPPAEEVSGRPNRLHTLCSCDPTSACALRAMRPSRPAEPVR